MSGVLVFNDGTEERFDTLTVDGDTVRAIDNNAGTVHMFARSYVIRVDMARDILLPQHVDNTAWYAQAPNELEWYCLTEFSVRKAYLIPAARDLANKHASGTFDRDTAIKRMRRAADAAAKDYKQTHGSMTQRWDQIFPLDVRNLVAEAMVDYVLRAIRADQPFWE
jgi:hypothetical protein